jgi:hypothetical protein
MLSNMFFELESRVAGIHLQWESGGTLSLLERGRMHLADTPYLISNVRSVWVL